MSRHATLAKGACRDFLICRLLPSDIISGSSQFSALKLALDKGFKVYALHSLHAKIYCLDDEKIYIGSANLTNNGLKIYGEGNLEANTQIAPSKQNLKFIDDIIESSQPIDYSILEKMDACLRYESSQLKFDRWPPDIILESAQIWVGDLFWALPNPNKLVEDHFHDLKILGLDSFQHDFACVRQHVLNTRCVIWLKSVLKKQPGNEIYFGELTRILHDNLKDDPAPYRREVKSLLQNLLAYSEYYLRDEIDISRPNYSQRIRLRS